MGLFNLGSIAMVINNASIIGNKAVGEGGGILNSSGSIIINNSTISNNNSTFGGGIMVPQYAGSTTLKNTILANNIARTSGPNCSGTLQSNGNNIVSNSASCSITLSPGDLINVNPQLGTFLPSEGYIPLLPTSPAINAGNPATCLAIDQRGIARPQGSKCDIGAYEYTVPGPLARLAVADGNDQIAPPNTEFRRRLQVATLDINGSPVSGVVVKFTAPPAGSTGVFEDTGTNTTTIVSNSGGLAQASSFKANGSMGTYTVVASSIGVPSVNLTLHNGAWFVIPTANGGSDLNDCLSPVSACASINGVLSKNSFQDGDPIWMSIGTYGNASDQVVLTINKPVNVYGGWDLDFTDQIGTSVIQDMIEMTIAMDVTLNRLTIQYTGARGVRSFANLLITDSTIRDNPFGGIENNGALNVIDSTITHNGHTTTGLGDGGIYDSGANPNTSTSIINSTITNNKGGSYGGVGGKNVKIKNTIIANNIAYYGTPFSPDCSATIISYGYNLIGSVGNIIVPNCTATWLSTDQVGYYLYNDQGQFLEDRSINPMLDPVQDFGNQVWVHPLKLGSPALDVRFMVLSFN